MPLNQLCRHHCAGILRKGKKSKEMGGEGNGMEGNEKEYTGDLSAFLSLSDTQAVPSYELFRH